MAELPAGLKHRISHRGRALAALGPALARAFGPRRR
jgi:inosine/xanthosine triphosphate pyrophosphatase family protein